MRKKIISKSIALLTVMSLAAVSPVTAFASVTILDGDQNSIATIKGDGDKTNEVRVNGNINDTTSSVCIRMEDSGTTGALNGKVTVTKDVNLSNDNTGSSVTVTGIQTYSASGGKAEVYIKGNLKVDANATGASSSTNSTNATGIYSAANTTVIIGDDQESTGGNLTVTAGGAGTATGIDSFASNKPFDIDVGGNIIATSPEGNADGIYLKNEISADIDVGGNIEANGQSAHGIVAMTTKNADGTNKIDVSVKGNIIANATTADNGSGIYVQSNSAILDIGAGGTVSGTNKGIYIYNNNNKLNISAGDDISGSNYGIDIRKNNNEIDIAAGDDISSSNYGIYVEENNNLINISAEGDITGANNAIYVDKNSGTLNIISEGTIKSTAVDSAAIYLGNPSGEYVPNITAWKVESKSGTLVASNKSDADYAEKLHNSINYIIRSSTTIDGKEADNKIVLTGVKEITSGDKTYQTANAGKQIIINVAASGYSYSLSDSQGLLTRNSDGSYTLVIPTGGGVDLQAVLEKINEDTNNNRGRSAGGKNSSYTHIVGGSQEKAAVSASTANALIETPGYWAIDALGNWIFANNGNAFTNTWIVSGGRWYFLDANGNPLTGWQTVGGANYYFSADSMAAHPFGSLYINETTPDGIYVNASGARTL